MERRRETRSIAVALLCFLAVIILNFLLPRLLPGNPVAYLLGTSEEGLTAVQEEYYIHALHLDEPLWRQFLHYLGSLFDGSLGYSFRKESRVAPLVLERLSSTFLIVVPAVVVSSALGLVLGLRSGYGRRRPDGWLTPSMIVLNAVPSFLMALVAIVVFGFTFRLLPYSGLSSPGVLGVFPRLWDRILHLLLPVSVLTLGMLPSRYLLVRNMADAQSREKYVLYAKERGLSDNTIRYSYILPNIIGPLVMSIGMSMAVAMSGSVVIENIFSIGGMGKLLTEAVYSLDYPLVQGVLFVSTLVMVVAIILSDMASILLDPRAREARNG